MPASIAAKRIAGRSIASRQIATKLSSSGFKPYVRVLYKGTTSWTCPETGTYIVVQWGTGGTQNFNGGGDGAGQCQTTRKLKKGDALVLDISDPQGPSATTVTFPDGTVAVANNGADGAAHTAGTATGGDVNNNGAFGVFTGAGTAANAGASGGSGDFPPVPGGVGGTSPYNKGPGSGSANNGGGSVGSGGSGQVLIQRIA